MENKKLKGIRFSGEFLLSLLDRQIPEDARLSFIEVDSNRGSVTVVYDSESNPVTPELGEIPVHIPPPVMNVVFLSEESALESLGEELTETLKSEGLLICRLTDPIPECPST